VIADDAEGSHDAVLGVSADLACDAVHRVDTAVEHVGLAEDQRARGAE